MTDIVERLRARKAFVLNGQRWMMVPEPDADCVEAADEIVRLRDRVTEAENQQGVAEHMQANLHGHIKQLEAENREFAIKAGAIDAENAKLREALERIAKTDRANEKEIARTALSEKDGKVMAENDKARTQALEEAAREVERVLDGNGYAETVAAAIRALKP